MGTSPESGRKQLPSLRGAAGWLAPLAACSFAGKEATPFPLFQAITTPALGAPVLLNLESCLAGDEVAGINRCPI